MPSHIFALGSNASGQLGIGHFDDTLDPQPCLFKISDDDRITAEFDDVREMVAGGNHTLILTTEGRLWATGSNPDGRCLISKQPSMNAFHPVETPSSPGTKPPRITKIAATWEASIIVLDQQLIFTCGSGSRGELGQGQDIATSHSATMILDMGTQTQPRATIIHVAAGVNHVMALTSAGDLFGWGSARNGQLGDDLKGEKMVWTPRRLETPFRVRSVVAGRDFTFIVGQNQEQALLGISKNFAGDLRFSLKDGDSRLHSGWSTVYHLSTGRLHAFGRHDRGQLPLESSSRLKLFAAGSEHCVACTENDDILAWGWGEHGNCGRRVPEKDGTARRPNVIPLELGIDEKITQVVAGCATSFVVLSKT